MLAKLPRTRPPLVPLAAPGLVVDAWRLVTGALPAGAQDYLHQYFMREISPALTRC